MLNKYEKKTASIQISYNSASGRAFDFGSEGQGSIPRHKVFFFVNFKSKSKVQGPAFDRTFYSLKDVVEASKWSNWQSN